MISCDTLWNFVNIMRIACSQTAKVTVFQILSFYFNIDVATQFLCEFFLIPVKEHSSVYWMISDGVGVFIVVY